MLVKFLQPENALEPIFVMLSASVMLVKEVTEAKALPPMAVIGKPFVALGTVTLPAFPVYFVMVIEPFATE